MIRIKEQNGIYVSEESLLFLEQEKGIILK